MIRCDVMDIIITPFLSHAISFAHKVFVAHIWPTAVAFMVMSCCVISNLYPWFTDESVVAFVLFSQHCDEL